MDKFIQETFATELTIIGGEYGTRSEAAVAQAKFKEDCDGIFDFAQMEEFLSDVAEDKWVYGFKFTRSVSRPFQKPEMLASLADETGPAN